MSKRPYYPIAQLHSKLFENGIIENIQWIDFSLLYKVANLPAYTPVLFQYSANFCNQNGLGFRVVTYRYAVFVDFAKVVRWGSNISVMDSSRIFFTKSATSPLKATISVFR